MKSRNCPFLTRFLPLSFPTHWACLSCLIFWSSKAAHFLRFAAWAKPFPIHCNLEIRHWACALTHVVLKDLLSCPTTTPSSSSVPSLPLQRPMTPTLDSANFCIKWWRSSDPSSKAPTTRPTNSPYCRSFLSTGPAPSFS